MAEFQRACFTEKNTPRRCTGRLWVPGGESFPRAPPVPPADQPLRAAALSLDQTEAADDHQHRDPGPAAGHLP
jgi:hypothetical protein